VPSDSGPVRTSNQMRGHIQLMHHSAVTMKCACLVAMLAYTAGSAAAGLSVAEAWQAAMRHDPAFEAAEAQQEAGRTHLAQARSLWMPTLSAQGGVGVGDNETHSSGASFSAPGFGSTNGVDFRTSVTGGTAHQWAFVADQPLFDADRKAGAATHRTVAAMSEVRFRHATQELLLRTARAYFAVITSRAQLEALRSLHAAAERARVTANARYEGGDMPVTDMREAQARADAIYVQQLDAQTAVLLSEAAFTDLTGIDAVLLKSLPASEQAELPKIDGLELWTQRALAGNAGLAMEQLAVDAANAEFERYDMRVAPRISLSAQVGREALRGGGDFGAADVTSREARIVLQASVPLFTGGLRSAQRQEASALARKARAELAVADQQVRQQVRSAWLALTTAAARVRALQRLNGSTQEQLDATRLGVEIGERTPLELLDAQAEHMRSGTNFQKSQAEWLLADLQLQAVAGTLSDADLERVDRHLVDGGAQSR
jgi:outer membrane protein